MLDKEFENNMKENKDLSKSFAIIFGIKPEEVPSKSSGKNDSLSNSIRTKKDADKFMEDLENIISAKKEKKQEKTLFLKEDGSLIDWNVIPPELRVDSIATFLKSRGWENIRGQWQKGFEFRGKTSLKDVWDVEQKYYSKKSIFNVNADLEESGKFFSDKPKMDKFYADLEKQVKENSKKTCVVFNNFLENPKDFLNKANCTTKEGISHNRDIKNTMSKEEELKQASLLENMKDLVKEVGMNPVESNKGEVKNMYKVMFKNNDSIIISENLFDSIVDNSGVPLSGNLSKLMWGLDEETGEKICLDSNSILAIVIHN